ncbi:MATE family efflux transporter [Massilia sp. W12]|uniref:MATE family efflux transporter n=1 Tax=Massilia sp. W12 TaxID=3126507 RepID=UPI0030CABC11
MNQPGKFVSGSTMRHVINMTATSTIGLLAIFVVDALNLFYIARLGQRELAAAVGYATTLLFFHTALSIGLSIAASAMCARALGAGERQQAQRIAGFSLWLTAAVATLISLLTIPLLSPLLSFLGAKGETHQLALRFGMILLPSTPILTVGMSVGALLRAVGDGKRGMYTTLSAALTTAILDPLFIFGLGMGLDGAALANILARCALLAVGLHGLLRVHRLYQHPQWQDFQQNLRPFLAIGIPAILTQIATPFGNAAVTSAMGAYGDEAVAGWAVVSRLIPVAFSALFALSGAVGPILGQNLGARQYARLRSTMRDSLLVTLVYVLAVWAALALGHNIIVKLFGVQGPGAQVVDFFCLFVSASFLFNGALFVANAAFNNLGYPFYSTMLNWGRSTLGVIPFIWLGGIWYGVEGIMAGYGLGVVLFGVLGVWLCFKVLREIESRHAAGA